MPFPVLSLDGICWIHGEFCRRLPDELLIIRNPDTGEEIKMVPGQTQNTHVKVGEHIAPDPENDRAAPCTVRRGLLPQDAFQAAANHRGWRISSPTGMDTPRSLMVNGRVSRLFSHALLRDLG